MGREQGHMQLCVEPGSPQSPMDTVIRPDPRRLGPGGRRGREAAERPPVGGVHSSGDEAGQAVCVWKLRARCPRGMKFRGGGGGLPWKEQSFGLWLVASGWCSRNMWHFL